ncbi:osteoclast-stimulating factor 1-like [Lycorma delicatula]|uniref:osteoclast-stimulating factor 1-like n=1 Tax=Lycorma delicatula TaxID=130591 RepID=UPI003F5157E2
MNPPPKPGPKPGHVKVVRALYNYKAQRVDELSFQEGDLLYVFDQLSDPNWWKARCGKKTGIIPSNYVETQTEMIDTPLHEAARRGNLMFLQQCLQQGVSPTGLDAVGNIPLYWACLGGHVDCVKELLAISSLPVNSQNKVGETALHAACSRGHYEVVSLLLQRGSDVTVMNKDKETPAMLAMDPAIINLLNMNRHHSTSGLYQPQDYADDSD